MRTFYLFRFTIIFILTLFAIACGGPTMIDPGNANLGGSEGFRNGEANLGVSGGDMAHTYSAIRSNVHYNASEDQLEITIFGDDSTGTYECILFFAIPNVSTWEAGDTVTIADNTFYGSISYGTADASLSADFVSLTSGALEFESLCLNAEECDNAASYAVTFTLNEQSMTVQGDYDSDYLILD